jgi:hypothetical protein
MRCPVQDGHPELWLEYCARTLDPGTAALLSHHMDSCRDCRRLAEAQQFVWSALDSWKPPRISRSFDDVLFTTIAADQITRQRNRRFGDVRNWRPALPIAVACGLMTLMFLLPRSREVQQGPVLLNEATHEDVIDAEQLDRAVEDMEMLRQFSTVAARKTL